MWCDDAVCVTPADTVYIIVVVVVHLQVGTANKGEAEMQKGLASLNK